MALIRFVGSTESAWYEPGRGLVDAEEMTTVEEFLRTKAALPPTTGAVI